ncbi:MAG: carboxypeptidase-like regulatory domain-containing protein [Candidatus Aenigmarchaeota archaeon]|nr:carboxypeptidase-like regulatory domain-containing protein [Candidatus Aenigmarchaeota archaeon]MDW8159837.1 carboxypeptidase-like regulatory domain-containing protein [Candidatus Aenigmarchaeota archaeon]
MSRENLIRFSSMVLVVFFLFLVRETYAQQQYGNLVINIKDCYTNSPLASVKIEVISNTDPPKTYTGFTNSDGYVNFYNLPIGKYSIIITKSGYETKNINNVQLRCGQTDTISECLNKIRICQPGIIRNRICQSDNIIFYEKCSEDGGEWKVFTETCPTGQICKEGRCVLEKDGWYDTSTTRCNNGVLEKKQEYRDYTCFGATCTYTVTQSRWISIGECETPSQPSQQLPTTPTEKDGWYLTGRERCNLNSFQCGYGVREIKEEYRDYYPIVDRPTSASDCGYKIINTRWKSAGECYKGCEYGYECVSGFCRPIVSPVQKTKCKATINVRDVQNNSPISNAKICYEGKCFETGFDGSTSFYIEEGSYIFSVDAKNYYTKTFTVTCSRFLEEINRVVYLERIIRKFNCNSLNGWYYTTLTRCEIGNFECGSGINLRREEYRDYGNALVEDLSKCKSYKVVGERWVEDGFCYSECRAGYICQEGFCRKVENQAKTITYSFSREIYREPDVLKIDLVTVFLILLFVFLLFVAYNFSKR